MTTRIPILELDATSYPEWRDAIAAAEAGGAARPGEPRTYPGYPRWALEPARSRWRPALDRVLADRRCVRDLDFALPARIELSRLLKSSHGVTGLLSAGPVPSAGGLQALELYLVTFSSGWLPAGVYHYDRVGHHLSQLGTNADRTDWTRYVPALDLVRGGSILWLLVGDGEREAGKYGDRACRFLLQESGHLMQNLCLVSASLGLVMVPLGGYFEEAVAHRLHLPPGDLVLYAGICGRPTAGATR
jgi:SagB-type dehydrogenase family enzyme